MKTLSKKEDGGIEVGISLMKILIKIMNEKQETLIMCPLTSRNAVDRDVPIIDENPILRFMGRQILGLT